MHVCVNISIFRYTHISRVGIRFLDNLRRAPEIHHTICVSMHSYVYTNTHFDLRTYIDRARMCIYLYTHIYIFKCILIMKICFLDALCVLQQYILVSAFPCPHIYFHRVRMYLYECICVYIQSDIESVYMYRYVQTQSNILLSCRIPGLRHSLCYGVATISRLLKIIGLFYKRAL